MKEKHPVTPLHVFFLAFIFMLQGLAPSDTADRLAEGWLVHLAVGILYVPTAELILHLVQNEESRRAFPCALGRRAGKAASAAAALYGAFLAGWAIRTFADFMTVNELNAAGRFGNTLLVGSAVFVLLSGREVLFRTAWIFQPLIAGALLLSICVTLPRASLENFPPLRIENGPGLLQSVLKEILLLLPPIMYPLFAVPGRTRPAVRKAVYLAGVSACLLLAVIHIRNIAVLGYPTITIFRYPAYVAAGTGRHTEVLISSAFALCQVFYAAVCLRFTGDLAERYPVGKRVRISAISCLTAAAFSFITKDTFEWLRLAFGAMFLLLLLLAAAMRKVRAAREKRRI